MVFNEGIRAIKFKCFQSNSRQGTMKFKSLNGFSSLLVMAALYLLTPLAAQAEELVFDILLDNSAMNAYPGTDGLIGTADDVVSNQPTTANTSGPNTNGSYSYNAFDFGSGVTDAPLLPTGFNAITFIEGTVTVDTDGFSMGGAIIDNMLISGTEPFPGHGPFEATISDVNSGTYNDVTGAFIINIDFEANLVGGSANGLNFDLSGEAWLVESSEFDSFNSNAYVRDVLIPQARAIAASKLFFMSATGTVPASSGGSGGSFPAMPISATVVGVYKADKWMVNDFNGDKRSDLPWRDQATGQNRLWLMNGPVREMAGSVPAINTDWIVAGTGDFNKDGMVDYYWRNTVLGINRIWFMDGLTRTGFERTLRMKDTRWEVAAICDLNNDGYADIIWRHNSLPQTRAWIMKGAMQIDRGALPQARHPWFIAACGDFDGDGNDDLLWRNATTGQNRIWLMKGTARMASGSINIANTKYRVGGVGDFTDDNKADIVFHDDLAGRTLMWEMDGLMRISGTALKLQNPAFTGTAIGDWGGDGKLDLFWRNLANGKNQIWNMDGTTRMSINGVVTMPSAFMAVP